MTHTPVLFVIDVGGSSLRANVSLDETRFLFAQDLHFDVDASADRRSILAGFGKFIHYLLLETQRTLQANVEILGIALAFPGPADYKRGIPLIRGLAKYEALYGETIRPALEAALRDSVSDLNRIRRDCCRVSEDFTVVMENDARLYAYGMWIANGRPEKRRIACLTLGTGLGSGFIVDGLLLTDDAEKNEAEGLPADAYVYHLPARRVTADDTFSTRGLVALAREEGLDVDNGKQLSDLADAGHEEANQVFARFGRELSRFIDHTRGLGSFRPDVVYLGGNLAAAADRMGLETSVPIELGVRSRYPLIGAANYFYIQRTNEGEHLQ